MSRPFCVPACVACGHAIWPPRPVCPGCGGRAFAARRADAGVVEETTRNEHTPLASVRSDAGPVVIARLEREVPSGARVELVEDATPDGDAIVVVAPHR
jgi:uncharacterized OB-fold protein